MDDLSPEIIVRELNTRFIGQRMIYFPTTTSTMEAARREARWGASAGTVVLAEEQTAGRGRLDRSWISPKGCLALSVILRPNLDYLPYLIMIASLAVVYGIEKATGIKPQIKWPNDVLIKDRKVCGILIENDIRKNVLVYSIIGVGINVNLHVPDYPEISPFATSLSDELGKIVSRVEIAQQLLIEMEILYQLLPQGETIFDQWKNRLVTLGQNVQITSARTIYRGVAESVAKDGTLMLRQRDGSLIRILAGDVSLRV